MLQCHQHLLCFFLSLLLLLQAGGEQEQILIDTTEYAALRVIRNALDDQPGSTFFSTWDFRLDPCTTFRGVVCSPVDDGDSNHGSGAAYHVVMLSLGSGFAGSPGLTGRLSPAIANLSFLRILTLVPGSVRGDVPAELASLQRLEFLGLSNNLLSGTIPPSLASLRSLQGLDLSNNKFEGSIPQELLSLPQLQTLILSANDLSGELPTAIASPRLTRLSLDRNQIGGQIPPQLPPSLVHLDMSRNSLQGTIPSFAAMAELAFLDLSFNRLSGSVPPSLLSLPSLEQLLLQRNSLSGELHPWGIVAIGKLDLSHNAISGTPPPTLATVRELLLNNNRMSGSVPAEIVAGLLAGGLRSLYLQHNFLSGIQGGGAAALSRGSHVLPGGAVFCMQYNCMQPPASSSCPSSSGKEPTRPAFQCDHINGDWD